MLRAGLASTDITPPTGLAMGGNARRDRAARGTHDPLTASALALDTSDRPFVLIACDLLSISEELSGSVKDALVARGALRAGPNADATDHVVVCASHTHSGPQVARDSPTLEEPMSDPDWEGWLHRTTAALVAVAEEAIARMEPARLRLATVRAPGLAHNRRLAAADGRTRMNWEPGSVDDRPLGPVDDELSVLTIHDAREATLGALIHFALHPAVLVGADWLWSADFVGPLRRVVRESLGDVPIMFVNGAEGDVNHLDHRTTMQGRDFAEAERIGRALADAAVAAAAQARALEVPTVHVQVAPISLRCRRPVPEHLADARDALGRLASEPADPSQRDGVPAQFYAAWLLRHAADPMLISLRPVLVRLGELVLVCLAGESFVEFGLRLRASQPERVVKVVGLSDASIGYLPTLAAFEQGGYETTFGTSVVAAAEPERLYEHLSEALAAVELEEPRIPTWN